MPFLSCAILAGVLLAATGAMAQVEPPPPPPSSCVAGAFAAEVIGAPTFVSCAASSTGQCTEIKYSVSASSDFQSTDHITAFEGLGVAYVKDDTGAFCTSSCSIFPECQGDNLTGIGKLACHEQAVRVNPNATKSTTFTIGLVGQRSPSPTSIVVKKGKTTAACRILGIGLESGPNPLATFTPDLEEVLGGKCKVHAHTNKQTGVTTVTLVTAGSDPNCSISDPIPIGEVTVKVGDDETGPVLLSEGFTFLVGTGTCAYKQYYPSTGPVYRVCW